MFASSSAKAQSFELHTDTVRTLLQDYLVDQYNYVKNLTNDTIHVSWKIFAHNLPQDWVDYASWGLCDNVLCYDKAALSGTIQLTDAIGVGDSCLFKGQMNGSSPSVTTKGEFYYAAEVSHGTTVDTAVFVISEWATNVPGVSGSANNVTLYPNPAKDELNVQFDKNSGVKSIAIYNLVGKQVSSFRVSPNSSGNVKLDINTVPSGVYFLRLKDNTGRVLATRRFTHQ